MRHMVRRLYVDGLPPNLFHQSRRSSTSRQQCVGKAGSRLNAAGLMQSAQCSDPHHGPPYSLSGSLWARMNRGDRATAPFSIFGFFVFVFRLPNPLFKRLAG